MSSTSEIDAVGELLTALWNEREALDAVLFKLVQQRGIVAGGQVRWLARADDELRRAIDAFRGAELARAVISEVVCTNLGLRSNSSLQDITAAAAEPFASLLDEHRTALRGLVAEVHLVADETTSALAAGLRAVRETLDRLDTSPLAGYDARGERPVLAHSPVLLDARL